jgi:hypothetical protein
MSMSVGFKHALDWVSEYDKELRATDPRFQGGVSVVIEDGSSMHFTYAFAVNWTDQDGQEWLCVFPEHHHPQVFPQHGVYDLRCYGPQQAVERLYAEKA